MMEEGEEKYLWCTHNKIIIIGNKDKLSKLIMVISIKPQVFSLKSSTVSHAIWRSDRHH